MPANFPHEKDGVSISTRVEEISVDKKNDKLMNNIVNQSEKYDVTVTQHNQM